MQQKSPEQELTLEEKLALLSPQLDLKTMRAKIEAIFSNNVQHTDKATVEPHLFTDLEVFSSGGATENTAVIESIDKTHTAFGRVVLEHIITTPLVSIPILKERQDVVRVLTTTDDINTKLQLLKNTEHHLLWWWEEVSEATQSLYDMVYFNIPMLGENINAKVNSTSEMLTASSYYSILISPIMTALGPSLTIILPMIAIKIGAPSIPIWTLIKTILRGVFKIDLLTTLPFKAQLATIAGMVLWLAFYLYSVYNTICSAIGVNRVIKQLHQKVQHVKKVLNTVDKLYERCAVYGLPFGDDNFRISSSFFKRLIHNCFDSDYCLLNNKGLILTTYRKICEHRDMLLPILQFIADLDCYNSIAVLVKTAGYCYPEYINTTQIRIKDMWHPYFSHQNFVTNSVKLISSSTHSLPVVDSADGADGAADGVAVADGVADGADGAADGVAVADGVADGAVKVGNNVIAEEVKKDGLNMLITGPNAAGKSTFIKGLALSVLFSQTIGVAAAGKMQVSPFEVINSYLHIPDCKGRESLFQAEMHRCKAHLDLLKQNRRSFVVIDEIFSSTNFQEGLAAASAVCKKLASFPNSVSIITTHFTSLGELDTSNLVNYRFNSVNTTPIQFNYKLERGVSKQFIALKLLREEGFDDELVDEAERFLLPTTSN